MTCASCLTNKSTLTCVGCGEPLCKTCAQFVDDETFSFYSKRPKDIELGAYCPQCFAGKVADELAKYNAIMQKAENVHVYLINQTKESRLLPRKERKLKVEGVAGEPEEILRLAFQAVQRGMNCIVDVDITQHKTRDGSYQLSVFSGVGIPTMRPERWQR